MAANDPWIGRTWKVYAVQGVGGSDLKPSDKEGAFTLSAVSEPATGKIKYYTVGFTGDNMPSCWQGLVLYPHGSESFAPPNPLLQPWTPSGDAPWLAAADAVREGLNDSMRRLQGVLNPGTSASNLTVVCVPNATTSATPLLVLELATAASSAEIQPQFVSGGGHGDN